MKTIRLIKVVIVRQSKNWLSSKKKTIKNLAKFKSLKIFIMYKKLIKNLVKFKISKKYNKDDHMIHIPT